MSGLSRGLALTLFVALPAAVLVGLLILAVETSWQPLRDTDRHIAEALHTLALGHPAWVRAMLLVSSIGSPTVMRAATGLLAAGLWLRHARRPATWIAATMLGGALIDGVLKTVVDRARPVFAHPVAVPRGRPSPPATRSPPRWVWAWSCSPSCHRCLHDVAERGHGPSPRSSRSPWVTAGSPWECTGPVMCSADGCSVPGCSPPRRRRATES